MPLACPFPGVTRGLLGVCRGAEPCGLLAFLSSDEKENRPHEVDYGKRLCLFL